MDRTGHQFGYRQLRPTTDVGNPISASAGGDIVAAFRTNGIWKLENNGTIPGIERTSTFGVGIKDGPGGGEFFFDNTRQLHQDADGGGLVHVPGASTQVLGAIVNPNTSEYAFGGGVVYYDLLNGSAARTDLTILDPTNNSVGLGMANSIGDLEAICEDAPIQIGNYVWDGINGDGVQDACEDPIPGVIVTLYKADGTYLATTAAPNRPKGEYYFTGMGAPGETWVSTPNATAYWPVRDYRIVFGKDGQWNFATGKLSVNLKDYKLTRGTRARAQGPTGTTPTRKSPSRPTSPGTASRPSPTPPAWRAAPITRWIGGLYQRGQHAS